MKKIIIREVNKINIQTIEGDYIDPKYFNKNLDPFLDEVIIPMLNKSKGSHRVGSYNLKHIIEKQVGYIGNYQLKHALALRGIPGEYSSNREINPRYQINKSFINELLKENDKTRRVKVG